jgi:hypothetical protein
MSFYIWIMNYMTNITNQKKLPAGTCELLLPVGLKMNKTLKLSAASAYIYIRMNI